MEGKKGLLDNNMTIKKVLNFTEICFDLNKKRKQLILITPWELRYVELDRETNRPPNGMSDLKYQDYNTGKVLNYWEAWGNQFSIAKEKLRKKNGNKKHYK